MVIYYLHYELLQLLQVMEAMSLVLIQVLRSLRFRTRIGDLWNGDGWLTLCYSDRHSDSVIFKKSKIRSSVISEDSISNSMMQTKSIQIFSSKVAPRFFI